MLKRAATTEAPLECTSVAIIASAAAKAGLKRGADTHTILPGLSLLPYIRTVLNPVASRRGAYIYHYPNGAVPSVLCSGVVAATLDPPLAVCTDLGPSTRTDRPAVRAWALRAEAAIAKTTTALPTLTSGKLTFIACESPSFPKSSDKTLAFMINIYVQHSGQRTFRQDCAR